jgi:hypothetical protein
MGRTHGYHKQQKDTRICNKCEQLRQLSDFQRNGICKDGSPRYRSVCKACGSKFKLVETKSTKTCCRCGRTYFPIGAFGPNGVWSECKSCRGTRQIKWYKTEKGKALVARCINKLKSSGYYKTEEHIQKTKARSALGRAVRAGHIIKPAACEICGATRKLQGHHKYGYSKEHYLDVVWLCAKCHYNVDAGIMCL